MIRPVRPKLDARLGANRWAARRVDDFTAWRRVTLVVAGASLLICPHRELSASEQTPTSPPRHAPRHVTPPTERAIERGLDYLVAVQGRDGAWSNPMSQGRYPVAMTGLAGLALLMDGNTTTQGRFAPNVDRAARFLAASATSTGLIARERGAGRPMYGHGFSMLFLAELYGMTEDPVRLRELHDVLWRAVDLTARSQSNLGGWYYTPQSMADEGSVTITQVQALRACRNAGIGVPKSVIDDAMNYLVRSSRSDGGIAYRANMKGPSRPPITAAAVCCWFNAGDYDNPLALKALEFAKESIAVRNETMGHYYYAHFYLAQALYLAGAKEWDAYFPKIRDQLLRRQAANGSWRGDNVGTVYGTALALAILQLPYNQLPIMQR